MCHYITLVVGGADIASIGKVMLGHHRPVTVIHNASLQSILRAGEQQLLTTRQCDCGCELVHRDQTADVTEHGATGVANKKRKNWSKTKLQRALADQEGSSAQKSIRYSDSQHMWTEIISELINLPSTRSAGLIVHNYTGRIEDDFWLPRRREIKIGDLGDALTNLKADELMIVSR